MSKSSGLSSPIARVIAASVAVATLAVAGCAPVEALDAPDASVQPAPGPGPDTTLTQVPAAVTRDTVARFDFVSEGGTRFVCILDDERLPSCVSPVSTPELSEGDHRLVVIAVDDAGVEDATPAEFRWRVDRSIAGLAIDSAPPVVTRQAEVAFTFAADEVVELRCRVDSEAAVACGDDLRSRTGRRTVTARGEGVHTFVVEAIDGLGNRAEVSESWLLDTTPPTVQITAGPAAGSAIAERQPTFAFVTGGNPVAATCRHDDGIEPVPCATSFTPPALDDGPRTVTVVVTDAAGNTASASRAFVVDTTGPELRITARPPSLTPSTSATINWTSDELATFSCSLDGGAAVRCGSGVQGARSASGLARGDHAITVTASDVLGNSTQATVAWTVVGTL